MNTEDYIYNDETIKRFTRRVYYQYIFEMGITAHWAQKEILIDALKAVASIPHLNKLSDIQKHTLTKEAIRFKASKYLEGIKQHTIKSFIFNNRNNRIYV